MATPRIPSQKKNYSELNQRLVRYVAQVQSFYDELNSRICKAVESVGYNGSSPFSFADYPELKKTVADMQAEFVGGLRDIIYTGTSEEWKQSNLVQDLLAKKVLTFYEDQVHGEKHNTYFQTNSDALKAFQERKDNGMNLSAKLWNQSVDYKKSLEDTISTAIKRGTSALTLSKQVSRYLNDFPSMQRDYKELYGLASSAKDCEYRSIRLARSEINMSYRTAEQLRWKQFDFVKGYKICLSKSHKTKDVCDILAGEYPKSFKWTGWHPNDMCYAIPIIASEDEYWSDKPIGQIPNVPKDFKNWTVNNREYIKAADKRGTLPYFLRDNKQFIVRDPKDIASARHAARTKADIDDIQRRWNLRKLDSMDRDDYKKISTWKNYLHLDTTKLDTILTSKQLNVNDAQWELMSQSGKVDSFIDGYRNKMSTIRDGLYGNEYGNISYGKYFARYDSLTKVKDLTPANIDTAMDKLNNYYNDFTAMTKNFFKKPIRLVEDIPYVNPGAITEENYTFKQYKAIVDRIDSMFGQLAPIGDYLDYKDNFAHAISVGKYNKPIERDFAKYLKTDDGALWNVADHYHELATADLKTIPKRWVGRFNKYINEIYVEDVKKYGFQRIDDKIEGAYNILKLSQSPETKEIGLANVSVNTPYRLLEIAKEAGIDVKTMAQRKFFDQFKSFVPLFNDIEYEIDDGVIKPFDVLGDAHYSVNRRHVAISSKYWAANGGRAANNPFEQLDVIYHEFGHAYGHQYFINEKIYKDKYGVKALLDKYKGRINKDHGQRLSEIFFDESKKMEYQKCYENVEDVRKGTNNFDEIIPVTGKVPVFSQYKYDQFKEMRGNVSDVLQAIFDDHRQLMGGHELKYMQVEENQLAEFFAHMSEFYWQGNELMKRVAPNLYKDMRLLMQKIVKAPK